MNTFPHSRMASQLGINFPFILAPMVGLSHVGLRELVRSYMPSEVKFLAFTEMLSTRRLPDEKLDQAHFLRIAENESHFVPQLLGNDEKYIAPSIQKLLALKPWGFDINMGCPVSHTLKHNWGVRLMGDKRYAAEVVEATKRNSPLPVSVKLRGGAGEHEDVAYLLDFTKALEDVGVDWLTVHPRPRAAGHKGEANWSLVSQVRNERRIPVVANGDIQTADDAVAILRDYKVDGAMIARAATARPWIFWQILIKLGFLGTTTLGAQISECPMDEISEAKEFARSCVRYIDILSRYFNDETFILERVRFHTATASRWLQFGHSFWKMTTKAKNVAQLREQIMEFGEKSENIMYGRVKML